MKKIKRVIRIIHFVLIIILLNECSQLNADTLKIDVIYKDSIIFHKGISQSKGDLIISINGLKQEKYLNFNMNDTNVLSFFFDSFVVRVKYFYQTDKNFINMNRITISPMRLFPKPKWYQFRWKSFYNNYKRKPNYNFAIQYAHIGTTLTIKRSQKVYEFDW